MNAEVTALGRFLAEAAALSREGFLRIHYGCLRNRRSGAAWLVTFHVEPGVEATVSSSRSLSEALERCLLRMRALGLRPWREPGEAAILVDSLELDAPPALKELPVEPPAEPVAL